jgi:hypothetical protein
MVGKLLKGCAAVILLWAFAGGLTTLEAQCTATFKADSKVTLTAKPCDSDHTVRWTGVTCQEGQHKRTCTFIMPEEGLNVQVHYDKKPPKPTWEPAVQKEKSL